MIVANSESDTISVLVNTSQLAATSFIEQTPVAVCSDIVISDPDGDANWNRGRLSVQISGNAEAADSLGLATSYPDNGGILRNGRKPDAATPRG